MRMNLRVSYLDGSAVDTTTSAADLIKFETKFDKSIAMMDTDLRYTDLAFLAWSSLKRGSKTPLEFDEWTETIEAVVASDEPAAIIPLEIAAPTG